MFFFNYFVFKNYFQINFRKLFSKTEQQKIHLNTLLFSYFEELKGSLINQT